ncbi:MAG: hypothetical protein ACRELG_09760 [Gemmataceae bacterium]
MAAFASNGSFLHVDGEQVGDGVADKDSQNRRQDHPQPAAPFLLAPLDVLFPLLQFLDFPLKEGDFPIGGSFEVGMFLLQSAENIADRLDFIHVNIQTAVVRA